MLKIKPLCDSIWKWDVWKGSQEGGALRVELVHWSEETWELSFSFSSLSLSPWTDTIQLSLNIQGGLGLDTEFQDAQISYKMT